MLELPCEAVALAAKYRQDQERQTEPDERVAECFVPRRPMMTARARSTLLHARAEAGQTKLAWKVNSNRVGYFSMLAASAAVEAAGVLWGRMLHEIKSRVDSGQFGGLLMVVRRRYDETPMRLRLSSGQSETTLGGPQWKELEASTHAKLLQSELHIAVLLEEKCAERPQFLHIQGTFPCNLQVMRANTGECLKAAALRHTEMLPGLMDVCRAFDWVLHQSTVDQFGANDRAERSMLHDNLLADNPVASESWVARHSKLTFLG